MSRPPVAISGSSRTAGDGMAGGADEPRVLVVGDWKAPDEETR